MATWYGPADRLRIALDEIGQEGGHDGIPESIRMQAACRRAESVDTPCRKFAEQGETCRRLHLWPGRPSKFTPLDVALIDCYRLGVQHGSLPDENGDLKKRSSRGARRAAGRQSDARRHREVNGGQHPRHNPARFVLLRWLFRIHDLI